MTSIEMSDRSYMLGKDYPERTFEIFNEYLIGFSWGVSDRNEKIYSVNWFIIDLYKEYSKENNEELLIPAKEAVCSPPEKSLKVEDWSEARIDISGFLKWDGCSELDCSVHFCSKEDRQELFKAIERAHYKAAEIMGKTFYGTPETA